MRACEMHAVPGWFADAAFCKYCLQQYCLLQIQTDDAALLLPYRLSSGGSFRQASCVRRIVKAPIPRDGDW